jgi:hypothetical protein
VFIVIQSIEELEYSWKGVGKAQNNYRTAGVPTMIYTGCTPKATMYMQLHCDYHYEHITI